MPLNHFLFMCRRILIMKRIMKEVFPNIWRTVRWDLETEGMILLSGPIRYIMQV